MNRIFLPALAVLLSASALRGGSVSSFVRGDANADGQLNITDPVVTLGYLFLGGPEPPCADATDADDSGLLNITDAIYSLTFLFIGGPAPPSPHPGCGSDPTADALGCDAFRSCGSTGCRPEAPTLDPYPTSIRAEGITLTGSVQPGAAVEVSGPNFEIRVEAPGGRFSVEVPLAPRGLNRLNRLSLQTDTSCGELSSPTTALVTHDAEPPSVVIDHPANGSEITAAATDVAGRVADLLSGFLGLEVSVNGEEAVVEPGIGTNGTFFLAGLPLAPGENRITAVATDALGNTARREVTVRRIELPAGVRRLEPVSGNGQSASVFRWLPDPIAVRLIHADGSPFAGKLVVFHVARSDGQLSTAPEGQGELRLGVRTDAGGLARAFWRLGGDAGRGNNRVEVTSRDITGKALFCASASAGVPSQINITSGNHQRVEVGGDAPLLLRARVSDGCNGVAGVPVVFTALRGGGKVNGEDSAVVRTADTGHAEVAFRLGNEEGNQLIRASFGQDGPEATFSIFGLRRDDGASTSFSGLVLDNASQPIEGATCILEVPSFEGQVARTDRNGAFHFEVPRPGPSFLSVNGLTATHVGGEPGRDVPAGSFPSLPYDFVTVPGAANSLPAPVLLPYLNPANARSYDGTRDVELTAEGVEGLKMRVKAGSMRRRDGSIPSPGDPAVMALNTVHHDDVPMPMPDGAAPPFAWTLQPAGAIFDPPVEVVYPNMSGLPAGAASYFLSFNHDTSRFEIVASGRVDDDGAAIRTAPGEGLRTAGWGCNCPPYSVTANCRGCRGQGGGAQAGNSCEECTSTITSGKDQVICRGKTARFTATGGPLPGTMDWSGGMAIGGSSFTDGTSIYEARFTSTGVQTVTAKWTCDESGETVTDTATVSVVEVEVSQNQIRLDMVRLKARVPGSPDKRFKVRWSARVVGNPMMDVDVVMTNPDGRIRFSEAADITKMLTLPRSGTDVDFQVSGENVSAARDDTIIEAHLNTVDGDLCGKDELTVYTYDLASIKVTAQGAYSLNPVLPGELTFDTTGGPAVEFEAEATLIPAGLDCTVLVDRIGIVQNWVEGRDKVNYGMPTIVWKPGVAPGTVVSVPTEWTLQYTSLVPGGPYNDTTADAAPLYDQPHVGDPDSTKLPQGCAGGGIAIANDTPAVSASQTISTEVDVGGVPVADITHSLANISLDDLFRTWVVAWNFIDDDVYPLRETSWSLNVDSAGPGAALATPAGADAIPTHMPVTSPPFANDVIADPANESISPAGPAMTTFTHP